MDTNANESLKPEAEIVINTPETLKVIADSVRLQIFDILTGEPRTVKQLAQQLGIALSKMYYHINLLEEHGLIRVVSTRMVSNLMEKLYQATAYSIKVDSAMLSFGADAHNSGRTMIATLFDMARREIELSIEAGLIDKAEGSPAHRSLLLGLSGFHLRPEQADDFANRLKSLIQEFSNDDRTPAEGTANYAALLSFFPVSSRETDKAETEYG